MAAMTHGELVKRAVRWLTSTQRCGVVLAEISTVAHENPDAIGWQAHKSILVECKTSRSDFLGQRDKPCVRANCLVGNERYYLCEAYVIRPEDVDDTGFGLLWVDGDYVRIRSKAQFRSLSPSEYQDERTMLVSALRRIKLREFLVIAPPESEPMQLRVPEQESEPRNPGVPKVASEPIKSGEHQSKGVNHECQ
jgi:hypothetical protein